MATGISPVFDHYAFLEPRLYGLVERCQAVKAEGETFCANSVWYGYDGGGGIKAEVVKLVGWDRRTPPEELKTEEAYDVVYQTLYHLLPDCKGECACTAVLRAFAV